MMSGLYVLFRIVPRASSVRHKYSYSKSRYRYTAQQSNHTRGAQDNSRQNGHHNGQKRRGYHLMECSLCTERYTRGVIRIIFPFHNAGNFPELTAYFFYNRLGGFLHRAHRRRRKYKRQHRADKRPCENCRIRKCKIQYFFCIVLHNIDVRYQERKGCQGGRANGKSLTCGCSRVAQRIQCIRAATHFLGKT